VPPSVVEPLGVLVGGGEAEDVVGESESERVGDAEGIGGRDSFESVGTTVSARSSAPWPHPVSTVASSAATTGAAAHRRVTRTRVWPFVAVSVSST
jgi:hypothetical protein